MNEISNMNIALAMTLEIMDKIIAEVDGLSIEQYNSLRRMIIATMGEIPLACKLSAILELNQDE